MKDKPAESGSKNKKTTIAMLGAVGFLLSFTTNFSLFIIYSLFLKRIGIKSLPYFYIVFNLISCGVGWFLLHRNITGLKRLFELQLVISGVFIIVSIINVQQAPATIFLLYILTGIFYIYSTLFYWNYINHNLTIGVLKKYSGMIAGISFAGVILAGAVIKPLLAVISIRGCYVTAGLIFVVSAIITRKASIDAKEEEGAKKEMEPLNLKAMFKTDLVRLMFFFTICLVGIKYFVDYMFSHAISMQFDTPQGVAGFFGIFKAVNVTFILITQVFITGKVMENHSLQDIYRGITALLAMLAVVYLFFPLFAVIVIYHFISGLIAKSIIQPTSNILTKSIPRERRSRTRFFIDGMTFSFSVMLTGVIIIFCNAVNLPVMILPVIILGLAAGVLIMTGRLNMAYTGSLVENLKLKSGYKSDTPADGQPLDSVLYQSDITSHEDFVNYVERLKTARESTEKPGVSSDEKFFKNYVKLVEDESSKEARTRLIRTMPMFSKNRAFEEFLVSELSRQEDAEIIEACIDSLAEFQHENAAGLISKYLVHSNVRVKASAVFAVIMLSSDEERVNEAVVELIKMDRAEDPKQRELAVAVMGELELECFTPAIAAGLKDGNPGVVKRSLDAALRINSPTLIPPLKDLIKEPVDNTALARAQIVVSKLEDEKYSEIQGFTAHLPVEERMRIQQILQKTEDMNIMDASFRILSAVEWPVSVNIVEFLHRENVTRKETQMVEECLSDSGFSLKPIIKAFVESEDEVAGLKKLLMGISMKGESDELKSALIEIMSGIADDEPGEDLIRRCFYVAGLCCLGEADAALIFENLRSGDKSRMDVAREVLNTRLDSDPLINLLMKAGKTKAS